MDLLNKIKSNVKQNLFGLFFILFGVLTQVTSYIATDIHIISLISGIAGILAVVLCSQRKLWSFYFFSWIQLFTYVYLAYQQKLYGELTINAFYAVTMIIGMYLWSKNYDKENNCVESKKLSNKWLSVSVVLNIIAVIGLTIYLKNFTDDTQPFMDSITTVPAFFGQILLMLKYREQWLFWFVVDVASIIMWAVAGDMCMVSQYIFWTLNCVYGYYLWSKK